MNVKDLIFSIPATDLADAYVAKQEVPPEKHDRAVERVTAFIQSLKDNAPKDTNHLILGILDGPGKGATVEVQLRTIATDCWASLEHQIKYKRQVPHEGLVREELKRCADEIASVDLSMETIRELLEGA